MDHGDHGSSMGDAPSSPACKISMLWNWTTVDACFISRQWQIRSTGGYVGTVIGVFLIVVALEGVRRMAREYDRRLLKEASARLGSRSTDSEKGHLQPFGGADPGFSPSLIQQTIRSLFYFVQFSTGYILMLLAMYYNGGLILAIFFGSFFGHMIFGRDTVGDLRPPDAKGQCCN
ncbi:hypothetical protein AX16_002433 [Volvariella volvacea WC 439]|nr:hypothetical protein AX16_002433 [Volvariella volvacea WC 439]